MHFTILDCYTDEPAGLGVPPYIGTHPRYIAGAILHSNHQVDYCTIDDLRFYTLHEANWQKGTNFIEAQLEYARNSLKTNIRIKNISKSIRTIREIFRKTDALIIVAGVHTPGRYLAAVPGTTKEVVRLLESIKYTGFTILAGPAASFGSGLWGGTFARNVKRDLEHFDLIVDHLEIKFSSLLENKFTEDVSVEFSYEKLAPFAVLGTEIIKSHPDYPAFVIVELETSRGCPRKVGCSFCTEPLKAELLERRPQRDILREMDAFFNAGVRNFRLGKQSCFYSYGLAAEIEKLLAAAKRYATVLHIDNVNPVAVTEEKTKLIVKYCTAGNIAAFGVESFDPEVIRSNNLNADPESVLRAVRILNKYGADRGPNGMPKFLPGINILFGLNGETRRTQEHNLYWLRRILEEKLLLRRINIREVVIFPGTPLLKECGDKYLRKNRKYYWKWRHEIRQQIDAPMLQRLLPLGTILRGIRTEIYDGKTTFGRQIGTYPLIVGMKGRLPLDTLLDCKISGHMLRSVIGEP